MKKILLALTGLVALSLLIVFAVNAQAGDAKNKKAATEMSQSISCCSLTDAYRRNSDSKICSAGKCDPVTCNGKCDPATCKKGKCDLTNCTGGKCSNGVSRTSCMIVCSGTINGPMNCNR